MIVAALVVLCVLQIFVLGQLWLVCRQLKLANRQSEAVLGIVGGAYAQAQDTIRRLKEKELRRNMGGLVATLDPTLKPRGKV